MFEFLFEQLIYEGIILIVHFIPKLITYYCNEEKALILLFTRDKVILQNYISQNIMFDAR